MKKKIVKVEVYELSNLAIKYLVVIIDAKLGFRELLACACQKPAGAPAMLAGNYRISVDQKSEEDLSRYGMIHFALRIACVHGGAYKI